MTLLRWHLNNSYVVSAKKNKKNIGQKSHLSLCQKTQDSSCFHCFNRDIWLGDTQKKVVSLNKASCKLKEFFIIFHVVTILFSLELITIIISLQTMKKMFKKSKDIYEEITTWLDY